MLEKKILYSILIFCSFIPINLANGIHLENSAFLIEGSGFVVSEDFIKTSEIDIAVTSSLETAGRTNFEAEDGFITFEDEEFFASELAGSFLRDGKYIRLNGSIESEDSNGSIRFFGKLIEETTEGSVYSFTGRFEVDGESYKIIYIAKISEFSLNIPAKTIQPTEKPQEDIITISILKGSSSPYYGGTYIDAAGMASELAKEFGESQIRARYFSQDRIAFEPGTKIKFVNNDSVSHTILSGKENYGDRYVPFTPDNRINTGEIKPGESYTVEFNEAGFYRLYDPDYTWMRMIIYSFPNVDSLIIRQGSNQLGN